MTERSRLVTAFRDALDEYEEAAIGKGEFLCSDSDRIDVVNDTLEHRRANVEAAFFAALAYQERN